MEVVSSASDRRLDPSTQQHQHQHQQQRRRPRRGRGQPQIDNAALRLRPSSIAPEPTSGETRAATDAAPRHRGRDGRGGRGSTRGRGAQPQTRTVNGRSFGGQLTREETSPSQMTTDSAQLQAMAPVFVPGQQHVHNVTQRAGHERQQQQPRQPRKKAPKSQAPDIATRTHEDIDNGYYECAICTSEVRRNSKVWSCHTCWTVFHLKCIVQWSSNQGSSANQTTPQDGSPVSRQWRCPGCNLPKDEFPKFPTSYTCWCEKEFEPKAPAGLPPHSCGQTCGRARARMCPHHCQLTCHAGPCPPCTHMGPTQKCFCGKHESRKRCSETDYEHGWSCGDVCGAAMSCGVHTCDRPCHSGPCGACEVRMPARCYCGRSEKDMLCSDRGEAKHSEVKISEAGHVSASGQVIPEKWTGVFDCGSQCDRFFDCDIHRCEKTCHPQEPSPGHCPRSPDLVSHCSCGKTPLAELSSSPRVSCEDPIPACTKPCGKLLACGHPCPQVCHTGDCPSCKVTVEINCRCGRTTSVSLCHQGQLELPQCRRVCRTNLNCGRHMCDEHCCAGERKAVERLASRKKQRPLDSAPRAAEDGFEAEHICTRQCGRPLKCGNHVCEELCHKGPCGSCRDAIFDEISCNCGRTVLQPPLPCGTQPPPCRQPCERPKACGHPQVAHNCHGPDASCPKCPFLVEKKCMCGKKALKNQQCWLRDVSCGQICGKRLRCGVHFCRKPCHRTSECEDASGQACRQACGKEKKICGHPDEAPCHAPFSCKEEKPCTHHIFITCACQAQKQEMRCGASASSEGNLGKSLPCNDECARLERNRKLALALNIDTSAHVDGGEHVPYSNETLHSFAQQAKWAQTQEREFRVFAEADEEKRLRFKPMPSVQRSFLRLLAEDFGLDSDSIDPEPHRHVIVWKTPRFVSAPNKTLADALRLRQQQQQAQRPATVGGGGGGGGNISDGEGMTVPPPTRKPLEPYNGFRIVRPRFGLTIDEVRAAVNSVLYASSPPFTIDIAFLPSEDIVLKAISRSTPAPELERLLQSLKPALGGAIASAGYGTTQLCATDSSLNIVRYESDDAGTAGDGWSRVAAKKAAPKTSASAGAGGGGMGTNAFAPLTSSGKVTFAKKQRKAAAQAPVAVADDWETAELAAEEREREREQTGSGSEDGNERGGGAPVGGVAVEDLVDHTPSSPSAGEGAAKSSTDPAEERRDDAVELLPVP